MKKVKKWKIILLVMVVFGAIKFIKISNSSYSGGFFSGDVAGNLGQMTGTLLIAAVVGYVIAAVWKLIAK